MATALPTKVLFTTCGVLNWGRLKSIALHGLFSKTLFVTTGDDILMNQMTDNVGELQGIFRKMFLSIVGDATLPTMACALTPVPPLLPSKIFPETRDPDPITDIASVDLT